MSKKDPTQLRIEIARGHWALGELDEAVACIERAVGQVADANPLMVLVGTLLDDVSAGPVVERLIDVRDALLAEMESKAIFALPEPMATPTMARLLADQGHAQQARAIAEEALRKNPGDERARTTRDELLQSADPSALALATLERWLVSARRRSEANRSRLQEGANA